MLVLSYAIETSSASNGNIFELVVVQINLYNFLFIRNY